MTPADWAGVIHDSNSSREAWQTIFQILQDVAVASASPVELHHATVAPDRLLSESAWGLWHDYLDAAPLTSELLVQWCSTAPSASGRAVLILDAFSLRELPVLLRGAAARNLGPVSVRVSGAEAPPETNQFAKALGASARSALAGGQPPSTFKPFGSQVYTDVLNYAFQDCVGAVPHEPAVFLWHSWLDDLIHVKKMPPEKLASVASQVLQSDGFWCFVDRLRQGRTLLITSDHGYANSKLFSSEERDEEVIDALRTAFGASRSTPATAPWPRQFMPPVVTTVSGCHVVMGQHKWKISGGFPSLCHGGLTLLEVAVPFVEFPPL